MVAAREYSPLRTQPVPVDIGNVSDSRAQMPERCIVCGGSMGEMLGPCWSCISAECWAFGRHQSLEPGPHGPFGPDLVIGELLAELEERARLGEPLWEVVVLPDDLLRYLLI